MKGLIKISIDAMGGDCGLATTVPAAVEALQLHPNLHITLVGDTLLIEPYLDKYKEKYDKTRIELKHATQVVSMDESPSLALRGKKDSSMRVSVNLVKDGSVSACVSAGNTGALMATSKFVLKMLPEIDRPAIVYALPTLDEVSYKMKSVYMLDLGANVGCSSEQLFQFGVMGSILSSSLSGIERPSVALLNIGEEEMKGLDSIKQAAKMLQSCEAINYIGYIEGNDIYKSKADVVVCDGFIGNIALKTSEGMAHFISTVIKDSFKNSFFSKVAMLLASPVLLKVKRRLDLDQYNGATLLGLRGIVIKSHGGATPKAFLTAIEVAMHEVEKDVPNRIQAEVESLMQQ